MINESRDEKSFSFCGSFLSGMVSGRGPPACYSFYWIVMNETDMMNNFFELIKRLLEVLLLIMERNGVVARLVGHEKGTAQLSMARMIDEGLEATV